MVVYLGDPIGAASNPVTILISKS